VSSQPQLNRAVHQVSGRRGVTPTAADRPALPDSAIAARLEQIDPGLRILTMPADRARSRNCVPIGIK
jgi:hypothetical protein